MLSLKKGLKRFSYSLEKRLFNGNKLSPVLPVSLCCISSLYHSTTEKAVKFESAMQNVKNTLSSNNDSDIKSFYDNFATNYDSELTKAGWKTPYMAKKLMYKYNNNNNYSELLLDCGCGTGMSGYELNKIGYNNIIGIDFSIESLNIAKSKKIYKELFIVNLNNISELNFYFGDNHFSNLVCMGVMPYIKDKLLLFNEFYRILKNNSIIIISYIDSDLDKEYFYFEQMENSYKWKLLEITNSMSHLPNTSVGWKNKYIVLQITK